MKKVKFDWDHNFENFLDTLSDKQAAKIVSTIKNIESFGLPIAQRQKWIKKIDDNLYEIRTQYSRLSLRGIYFQLSENTYFIVVGFIKKTNKTPKLEIIKAKNLRDVILATSKGKHNE